MISLGYNRLFLEGFLDSFCSTSDGVVFDLRIGMPKHRFEVIQCISGNVYAKIILLGRIGDRVLVRGSLRTNPVRIHVEEVVVLGLSAVPEILVDSVVLVDDLPIVVERTKSIQEHAVDRHERKLASGRVVWVKSYTRGGKHKLKV